MSNKKKYYAVRKGRQTGIFYDWNTCKEQINGFSGAEYKSFPSEQEAKAYIANKPKKVSDIDITMSFEELYKRFNTFDEAIAYVDGSYDETLKKYASSEIIITNGELYIGAIAGNDELMLPMKNVAGEILAAMRAVEHCIALGVAKVYLCYDYEGIEKWCTEAWACNKEGTKLYKEWYDEAIKNIDIEFIKVAGHTGVELNEKADELAKKALREDII